MSLITLVAENIQEESKIALLLKQMIELSLIDHLYLTKNTEKNGENKISIEELIAPFKLLSSEKVGTCEFMHYQKL